MNPRKTLTRKVIYMALMAALLMPLYWLGQPPSPPRKGGKGSPGGKLSQLRDRYGLAQTQLGQIDPASETVKWASLGMRGVAANILWLKAENYKMKKDWTNFTATLNQLIMLQPNFVSVWQYQAWNYSYNISAEFDDYRQRYRYVIKGIHFLEQGLEKNQREPILAWDIGWFLSNKIGRADEWKQFRRLFKKDDDFHGPRLTAERDNWLVGKQWFLKVQDMVDGGARIKKSPVLYRSDGPKCQFNYAETIEKEGVFGQVARLEWRRASEEWNDYGNFDLPTSGGETVNLNAQEACEESARKAVVKLESLSPGLREKIVEEKRKALSPEQREALDAPAEERTAQQRQLAEESKSLLFVTHDEVARRIKGENRKRAAELAKEAVEAEQTAHTIQSERNIVNFLYWRMRADVEQTDDMVSAREAVFNGQRAFARAELLPALEFYEKAFRHYRKIFDEFPKMFEDREAASDLMQAVREYQKNVLPANDKTFPDDFILKDVVEELRKQFPEDDKK